MARDALSQEDRSEMSEGWMRDHPDLAGAALEAFFRDHPPEQWELTMRRANTPGMWLSLVAKKRA